MHWIYGVEVMLGRIYLILTIKAARLLILDSSDLNVAA